MENFIAKFAETIDADAETITATTKIAEIPDWDSLSVVSVLTMINLEYDKTLRRAELKNVETVGDLYALVEK